MSGMRRKKYERLLRWYPKGWRAEHGRFMLDTLDEHAADRALARPPLVESWSIRSHGLGERATYSWAVGFAAVSLVAFILAAAILLSDALTFPGADTVRTITAVFIGPLNLALATVVLLLRKGQLSAPASVLAAVFAVPALACATLAAASWSAGFQEADAGAERTWFASATLLFIVLAWLAGSLALLAPVSSMVARELPVPARRLVAVIVSAVLSVVFGVLVIAGQMLGSLVAAAVLLVAVLAHRRPVAETQPAMLPTLETRHPQTRSAKLARPAVMSRSGCAEVGVAALFSLVFGIACAAFALTGSAWAGIAWADGVRDSTHAMNLGLAAGALAALPAVAGLGVVLRHRFGPALGGSAVLMCAGLVVVAGAQFLGTGHRLQWPLILAAAFLVGLAFAVPLARIMSPNPVLRVIAAVGLGLAGSLIGIYFVTAAAFIVPLVAAGLFLWVLRRLTRGRQPPLVPGRA